MLDREVTSEPEVLVGERQGEPRGEVAAEQRGGHPLRERHVLAHDASLAERLDEARDRDAGLGAEGEALGEQQVDAHRQRVVDELGDRPGAELAHPHHAPRERVEHGPDTSQDGLVATDEQRELAFERALASAVKGRVEQVSTARLQRVTDLSHDGRSVRGVVDHHGIGGHALDHAAGPEGDGLHLRRTGNAGADDI